MRCVRAVLAAGFAALTLQGQEAPSAVSDPVLEELLQAAERNSPELLAAREQAAAAAQQPALAGSLPNPSLALRYANDGWSPSLGQRDMSTLELMWSQAFPPPGQRRLRVAQATSAMQLEAARADQARRAVRAAVKRGYVLLRLTRSLTALTHERAALLRETEGVTRARYAVGQGGQQDVLRAQVELTRALPLLESQQAEGVQRLYELNRLVGQALETPLDTPGEWQLDGVGPDDETWLARARRLSPELAAAELQTDVGRLDVDLARRESKPEWALQAGYANRGRLDPMWQAGVAVSLPLRRSRLAAGVAAAEARVRASAARRTGLSADLELGVRSRLVQLRAAERSLALYDKGLLPQGRLSVEAAIASYQAGKVPFVTVLEAQSSLYADRSARLRLLAAHGALRASLEELQLDTQTMDAPADGGRAQAGNSSPMAMEP